MIKTALISAASAIATYLVTYFINRKKNHVSTIDEILKRYEDLTHKYINLAEAYVQIQTQIQNLQIEATLRKNKIQKLEQQLLKYQQQTSNIK